MSTLLYLKNVRDISVSLVLDLILHIIYLFISLTLSVYKADWINRCDGRGPYLLLLSLPLSSV